MTICCFLKIRKMRGEQLSKSYEQASKGIYRNVPGFHFLSSDLEEQSWQDSSCKEQHLKCQKNWSKTMNWEKLNDFYQYSIILHMEDLYVEVWWIKESGWTLPSLKCIKKWWLMNGNTKRWRKKMGVCGHYLPPCILCNCMIVCSLLLFIQHPLEICKGCQRRIKTEKGWCRQNMKRNFLSDVFCATVNKDETKQWEK